MSDELPICERCAMRMVPECGGIGSIPVETEDDDEELVRLCPNIRRQKKAAHLGPEIMSVQHVVNSPLLVTSPDGGPPIEDLTTENLFIHCTWGGLLPHLKWALWPKPLTFFVRIIDDQRIKNVFVGNESYKSRTKDTRDEVPTFNGLKDLVEDPDLVIIKLGYLGYSNKAAAGALRESLLIREAANKPTWIVLDEVRPWNVSRDVDVEYHIKSNFRVLVLKPADPGEGYKEVRHEGSIEDAEDMSADEATPPDTEGQHVVLRLVDSDDDDGEDDATEVVSNVNFDLPGEEDIPPWKRR